MDHTRFKLALSHFLSGVTVVTTERATPSGPELCGMTASAFLSVSLDPPLVLVSVAKTAQIHGALAAVQPGPSRFAISLLAHGQDKVSNHFAGWKDPAFTPDLLHDRFRTPVIAGALAWLDLDLEQAVDAGDHTLFIGRVIALDVADAGQPPGMPLAYYRGKYGSFAAG